VSFRAVLTLAAAAGLAALPHAQSQAPTPPAQLAPLPLTQLDERQFAADLDNRSFTLTFAQPVPIRDLLLLLVRGTTLSLIPDPETTGSFIGELKNVTVRQALGLILPPLGLDYTVDGPFIRVSRRQPATRLFTLNYISAERSGAAAIGARSSDDARSSARVTTTATGDVFADMNRTMPTLLSDHGVFSIDRKAGLLQVTDFPERLDRVATYLDAVQERVQRQVQIDASILEVELSSIDGAMPQSLDWAALARADGQAPAAAGSRPLVNGMRVSDVGRFLTALARQGTVIERAQPRVLALNNEPAIVRGILTSAGGAPGDIEELTLGVTAQVGEGVVTLSLSPIVSVGHDASAASPKPDASRVNATATREADTLARLRDGETIVLAGFTRERETRERKNGGVSGGWFGRSTVVTKKRVELLVLVTPRIVS
jgi:type II secretory pathway component GspD/PulD (secretin)